MAFNILPLNYKHWNEYLYFNLSSFVWSLVGQCPSLLLETHANTPTDHNSLYNVTSYISRSDTIGKVGPVAWMVELFGPSGGDVGFADEYFANAVNSLSSRGDGRRPGGCVHEDGGRYAVFQSTEGDAVRADIILPILILYPLLSPFFLPLIHDTLCTSSPLLIFVPSLFYTFFQAFSVSKVSPGVFRGPLFKVVSCACARDKQLKVHKPAIRS